MMTTTPLLKKLEHKFVLIDMLLVLMVLVIVFTTILVMNHSQREREVTQALETATSVKVSTTGIISPDVGVESGTGNETASLSDAEGGQGGGDGSHHDANKFVSTSSYQVDDDYEIIATNIDALALSSDTLTAALAEVETSGNDTGRLNDLGLYYQRRDTPDGFKVAFASTDYVDSTTLSLALQLLLVGGCAIVAFLIISIFLSHWALRPVRHAWAQQQQFVADASHELKTPLTVLLANNSILMEHPEKTILSQMQWIESSDTEAHLMQNLVNDLLFLAKPDDQQQHLIYTTIALSTLVESNVLQFESIAFEKGLKLASDIEDGIECEGNELRLQRLIGTLVDNACKYADEGSTITATLRRQGHDILLSVNDQGDVISKEDQEHIFDRFWRADKARARTQGGYGLGLAIAKEIASEHGASIAASSYALEGTTFTVTFHDCSQLHASTRR